MSVIPEIAYETVERKLRQRGKQIRKAQEAVARARAKATDISAPSGISGGGKGGLPGSRVERGAMNIVRAEKRLENLLKWEEIFLAMDRIYPAEDSNEGFVASMIYGNGMSQADLARFTGCSRQTIKMRQDRYVIRCAFMAAQAGLIREEVEKHGDADQKE